VTLSAFDDRAHPPVAGALAATLGAAVPAWNELQRRLAARVAPLEREWGFTSQTTGWGMRLKHGQRVVLYMTPGHGHFVVSFALGEKAVAAALAAGLPAPVDKLVRDAPRYAEGRGVRVVIHGIRDLPAVEILARAKLAN
jgi:hypothetical protein